MEENTVVQLDTALMRRIQDAIQVKLRDFNDGKDDPFLAEYVMLMLGNQKTKEQIAHELDTFFTASNAHMFTDWLWDMLLNLTHSSSTTTTTTTPTSSSSAPTSSSSVAQSTAPATTTTNATNATAKTVSSVAHRAIHNNNNNNNNHRSDHGANAVAADDDASASASAGAGADDGNRNYYEDERESKRHQLQRNRHSPYSHPSGNRIIDLTRKSGPLPDHQVPLSSLPPTRRRRRNTPNSTDNVGSYSSSLSSSPSTAASATSSSITMVVGDDNQPQYFTKKFLTTQHQQNVPSKLDQEDFPMYEQSEQQYTTNNRDVDAPGGQLKQQQQHRHPHSFASSPPATHKMSHQNRVWYNPQMYSQSSLNYALGQKPNMVWQRPKEEQQ